MTQNFTVVETQTEKKGSFVSVKDTVSNVRSILDGKVDGLVPEDLLFIATLKDVEEKLVTKEKEKAASTTSNQIQEPESEATSTPSQITPQTVTIVPAAGPQPPAQPN